MKRLVIGLKICLLGLGLAAGARLGAALAFPEPPPPWLSLMGIGTPADAAAYYSAINAPANFNAWKTLYGFPAGEVRATYYNAGDLGFGREMHCRQAGADVACYVVNHGIGVGAPPELSADAAANNQNTLAAVAMVWHAGQAGQPNEVQFYIYNTLTGARLNSVGLDGQGEKYLPQLCLACHGATATVPITAVVGAHFLPFDIASFRYSAKPGFTRADQEDALRRLNALVRSTNPPARISELIDGWYAPGGVSNPASTFDDNFVPPAYSGSVDDSDLYNNVVKHYCRSCHVAQVFDLANPAYLDSARSYVFNSYYMPHAELTNHNFWSSGAPAFLANNRGWSIRVNSTLDGVDANLADGVCQTSNVGQCTLRAAVQTANALTTTSPAIITFDVNGSFTFSLSGVGEDAAAAGDLDLTRDVTILGNGPAQTVIDAAGLDRVFDVLGGVHAVIQDVTIRGGSTPAFGGGVRILGTLDLNRSVVRNNSVTDAFAGGGGLANSTGATLRLLQSTVGPDNSANAPDTRGGGVFNESGTLELAETTLTGNIASHGGAIYNTGTGAVMTITHATVTDNFGSGSISGIFNDAGTRLALGSSLITGNGGDDCFLDGTVVSLGFNQVGEFGSANGCPTGGTNQVIAGSTASVLDLNLANNWKGQPYHPLVPGSPAIDSIPVGAPCTLPSYDQRNSPRPADGNLDGAFACDAGAREFVRARVTTTLDLIDDDGLCSLREAVLASNSGLPGGVKGGECPAGPDVIDLAVPGPYELDDAAGSLNIFGSVILNGHGRTIEQLTGSDRVMTVAAGGYLNLVNVTLSGGSNFTSLFPACPSDCGAGLLVEPNAAANILNSAFVNNNAGAGGGGIYNQGWINIANSTVAGNSAQADGGGILNDGTMLLTNVTISDNAADADEDNAGNGGGLAATGVTTFIKNSLIAGNRDLSASVKNPDVYTGTLVVEFDSYDYNLVGDGTGAGGAFSQPHDQVGTAGSPINPRLGPLAGAPPFLPLKPGSPALNRIPLADCVFYTSYNPLFVDAAPILVDQRGGPRRTAFAGLCDIGAVEQIFGLSLPIMHRQP
jgi:CSLREA domain-containing protein